jgi:hypothetical protein
MAQRTPHCCSMYEMTGLGWVFDEEDIKARIEQEIKKAYKNYKDQFHHDHGKPAIMYIGSTYANDQTKVTELLLERGFKKVFEYETPHNSKAHVTVYMLKEDDDAAA